MSVSSCDNDRTLSQILSEVEEKENRNLFAGNRFSPLSDQWVGNKDSEGQWSEIREDV